MPTNWTNPHGGRRWRRLDDGRIEIEDAGVPRTEGPPKSMRLFWEDFGPNVETVVATIDDHIDGLSTPDDVAAYVAAIAGAEAARKDGLLHMDPHSVREEPGYESDETTPHRVSPGLMQTLISTAQQMSDRYGLFDGAVTRKLLFNPTNSILAGTCYMAHLARRHCWDPIIICAAYNAGGVYEDDNEFNLRVYGVERIWRFVRYFNDFLACDATPC